MLLNELIKEAKQPDLQQIFKDFFPLAMKEIGLKELPKIVLVNRVEDQHQPTFGKFVNDKNVIYLGCKNRHPLDILRTLAHELVHFKQGEEHRLDSTSGHTGSPIENEAHEVAGIIMRHFNKKYSHYFNEPPFTGDIETLSEGWQDFKKEFKKKGKQSAYTLAALAGMTGILGKIPGPDYSNQPTVQQAQQGDDEYYAPVEPEKIYSKVVKAPDYEEPATKDAAKVTTVPVKEPPPEIATKSVAQPHPAVTDKTADFRKESEKTSQYQIPKKFQRAYVLPNARENNIKNALFDSGVTGVELYQLLAQIDGETHFTNLDERFNSRGEVYKSNEWFKAHYWDKENIRKALGNIHPSDAWVYRGRGLLQITGRDNYKRCGEALGIDLLKHPQLITKPEYEVRAAKWFWDSHIKPRLSLEELGNTHKITRIVNKGESDKNVEKRHQKFKDYVSDAWSTLKGGPRGK